MKLYTNKLFFNVYFWFLRTYYKKKKELITNCNHIEYKVWDKTLKLSTVNTQHNLLPCVLAKIILLDTGSNALCLLEYLKKFFLILACNKYSYIIHTLDLYLPSGTRWTYMFFAFTFHIIHLHVHLTLEQIRCSNRILWYVYWLSINMYFSYDFLIKRVNIV